MLDAAHILGHAESGVNHSDNGILLRSDLHDLFDAGLLLIDSDTFAVQIDESLRDSSYWDLHGGFLRERVDGSNPSSKYLFNKNRSGG